MVNSCRRYDDSEHEERAPKVYKCWRINKSEDEEKQDLPKDYENDGYIPLPFLKLLNCLVNLGKGTKSLTHLVSIESKRYQVKYYHGF